MMDASNFIINIIQKFVLAHSVYYFLQKQNTFMYKSQSKNLSSPHLHSHTFLPTSQYQYPPLPPLQATSKIDLRKINEYLEERISRKANRNGTNRSRKEDTQPNYTSKLHHEEIQHGNDRKSRERPLENFRESRVRVDRDTLSPKVNWKKHQSIQKLLGKENQSIEMGSRGYLEPESSLPSLIELERKYQQLQEKYRQLITQAVRQGNEYESDKAQLNSLKEIHYEDQLVLAKLKNELIDLEAHQNAARIVKTETTLSQQKLSKSRPQQYLPEEDISTMLSSYKPAQIQQMWRAREQEEKEERADKKYESMNRNNRTSESWMTKNEEKNNLYQSQHKLKPKERYYSAEKYVDSTKRGDKTKKSSDHSSGAIQESKTSIKLAQSLRGSNVRLSIKPDLPKYEPESNKITPTNLHKKKVVGSNLYSKYRFQPTIKLP